MKYRVKWKNVQSATSMFCHRWIKEYLPTLVDWEMDNEIPKLRYFIYLPVEHTARSHWPLGWIVDVYPGKGKIVCSAELRTPNGEFVRPSARFCFLEASCEWLEHGFAFLVKEESMLHCKNKQIWCFANVFKQYFAWSIWNICKSEFLI